MHLQDNQRRLTARGLRQKGFSYSEILLQVPASKSSISLWCRDIKLGKLQQQSLRSRGGAASGRGALNKQQRADAVQQIKKTARQEMTVLTKNEFKLAGLMLYWAEGAKSRLVDFANSDPRSIRFMMLWLREVCEVRETDFRLQLHLHSGQSEIEMKNFWAHLTGVPLTQFHKSYIKPEGTGHRQNRLYYGTIKIRVCNKNLLYKILGWIEGVSDNLWAVSSVGRADDSTSGSCPS